MRWCSNANSNTDAYSDTYTYADSNPDAYANTNSDACAVAKRAHESSWERGVVVSNQFVVDR